MFNRAGKATESHLINKAQQLRSEVLEVTKVDGDVYHTLGLLYLNYALNLYYNNGLPEKWLDLAESEFTNANNYTTKMGDIWLSFSRLYSSITFETNCDFPTPLYPPTKKQPPVSFDCNKAPFKLIFNELLPTKILFKLDGNSEFSWIGKIKLWNLSVKELNSSLLLFDLLSEATHIPFYYYK